MPTKSLVIQLHRHPLRRPDLAVDDVGGLVRLRQALVGRRLPIAEAAARPSVFELALFLRLLASDGAIDEAEGGAGRWATPAGSEDLPLAPWT